MAGTEQASEVKREIMRQALRLFSVQGYGATSVQQIVEAAGVTKPTLYYYFRNKEDLFRRLVREYTDTYIRAFESLEAREGSLEELLTEVVAFNFRFFCEEPLISRLFYRIVFGLTSLAPEIDFSGEFDLEDRVLTSILARAAERGEIPAERVNQQAVVAFQGAMHIYTMRQAMGFEDELSPDTARQVVRLFLQGLRN